MLEIVEGFAREIGDKRLFLSTPPFLERAIRLYESVGFRRSSEGPFDLHGTPIYTMIKDGGQQGMGLRISASIEIHGRFQTPWEGGEGESEAVVEKRE